MRLVGRITKIKLTSRKALFVIDRAQMGKMMESRQIFHDLCYVARHKLRNMCIFGKKCFPITQFRDTFKQNKRFVSSHRRISQSKTLAEFQTFKFCYCLTGCPVKQSNASCEVSNRMGYTCTQSTLRCKRG